MHTPHIDLNKLCKFGLEPLLSRLKFLLVLNKQFL
ncbi:hypothetical protein SLEP1_g55666 [Rubroshorea leprosula]|uniref:Uncharacterized protein n=1 Tax=Rubroshorea leprosula TaxID=152421 RepID=A0AAV5MJW7_9ROSI|nr:hypothetical protein SLEP1_g55666 [Rubroshorea leprosula]